MTSTLVQEAVEPAEAGFLLDQAESDAREFARVLEKNWDGGLLVARSAEKGKNGPRTAEKSADSKLSLREFSERARVDDKTVARYLNAWNRAAEQGIVPPANELFPGQHLDLTEAKKHSWDAFYTGIGRREKPSVETPKLPVGVYSTIVADPPWEVKAGPAVWGGNVESQALEYPTMTVDEIKVLDVEDHAHDDAVLYLWTINRYIEDAYEVARAWGFKPSTLLTWCKPKHGLGLGGKFVLTTEHIVYATRGKPGVEPRHDSTWFHWPRRRHSEKPYEFFQLVQTVSVGPYLEMFAREPRDGWTPWGNEVHAHT